MKAKAKLTLVNGMQDTHHVVFYTHKHNHRVRERAISHRINTWISEYHEPNIVIPSKEQIVCHM